MTFDLAVVGAGLTGAVIAERAARLRSWRVVVVEQRDHIAGNAYDGLDPYDTFVHWHGPHVFHTNSVRVWQYLSEFTTWRHYVHRVEAEVDGDLIPLPINLRSIIRLLGEEQGNAVVAELLDQQRPGTRVPILRLLRSRRPALREAAKVIFDRIYAGYTLKQWGVSAEGLDPSVTGRVPIRVDYDDRYFTDRFQGLPTDGYTALVARMLDQPGIEVLLDTDFHEVAPRLRFRRLVYTGPIDRFFDYQHGELGYRTLRFEMRHFPQERVQATSVVTYPDDRPYTRTCEFKLLTGRASRGTTIAYEYPSAHFPGRTTPYYPIPTPENRARYRLYAQDAAARENVWFCGRLGSYSYLNMDQAVAQALKTFRTLR